MKYEFKNDCQITGLDQIYLDVFGFKTDGSFVEVGAYDGETHSNTSCLADLGWTGLYIEPVPEHVAKCKERHANNNVKVLELAVSNERKPLNIHLAGELSSSVSNPEDLYRSVGLEKLYLQEDKKQTIQVQADTLNNILTKADEINPEFDLLVIDCESTELDVLNGFSIDIWKPKMVIIEMHEMSGEWMAVESVSNQNKLIHEYFSKYFSKYGYKSIFADPINTIFVKL